ALIVFSQATLALEDRKLRGVYLLQKNELVEFLQSAERVASQPDKHESTGQLKRLLARFEYDTEIADEYKLKAHCCWKCKKSIPVFTWKGHQDWDTTQP